MMDFAEQLQHLFTAHLYCARCLQTKRFLDRPGHMQCETCGKRLDKVETVPGVKR
jgi:NADH pyrophosphatase NudC (nudix superfamily)